MFLPMEERFIIQRSFKRIQIWFEPRPKVFFQLILIANYIYPNAISS